MMPNSTIEMTDAERSRRWKKISNLHPLAPSTEKNGRQIGVDRKENCIRGMILAQEGPFKSEGRGEFDAHSLLLIRNMVEAAPNGLKSRFCHPDESNDGLGKFLGRIRNPWIDTIEDRESWGQLKTNPVQVVRGDLYFDPTALKEPPEGGRPFADYLMELAETDSDAFSSSLVLTTELEYREDSPGHRKTDPETGDPLPPLWRPTALHASDIVDTGDAVDGLLSAGLSIDGLPDAVVRRAEQLMNDQFAGKSRAFVEEHCATWLGRYLDRRYGEEEKASHVPSDNGSSPKATGEAQTGLSTETSNVEPPYDDSRDPNKRRMRTTIGEI